MPATKIHTSLDARAPEVVAFARKLAQSDRDAALIAGAALSGAWTEEATAALAERLGRPAENVTWWEIQTAWAAYREELAR